MEHHARETAFGYCAGCAHICESAADLDVPISGLLRCSMVAHGYASRDMALSLFNTLPPGARDNAFKADYSKAEKSCPQKIQIGRVLKKACEDLSYPEAFYVRSEDAGA